MDKILFTLFVVEYPWTVGIIMISHQFSVTSLYHTTSSAL